MSKILTAFYFAISMSVMCFADCFAADDVSGKSEASKVRSDNSKVNEVETSYPVVTAEQQSNSKMDLEISRQLRQALVKDDSLSTYAQNVKIITQNGIVTLKGPVRTEGEKKLIVSKAKQIKGCKRVQNELEITSI